MLLILITASINIRTWQNYGIKAGKAVKSVGPTDPLNGKMIPDFTTLPNSVSIVNNTAVCFFFYVQGGVKVLVLTPRLSVCRWWEETCWQERGLVQGHCESGLICLPSWTDSQGRAARERDQGPWEPARAVCVLGPCVDVWLQGMPLGSCLHLCKSIHMSAPGCTAGARAANLPPVLHLLLSSGSKKGLSCRASLLFAIIWQVAVCEAAELKRRITLMKPLMGVGCRAPSR